MRTTLTLEPDVADRLQQVMKAKGEGLKAVVNDALRRGLGIEPSLDDLPPFEVEPHSFGFKPGIDLDRMNHLADELETEAVMRKMKR